MATGLIKPFHIKKALAWVSDLFFLSSLLRYSQEKFLFPFIRGVYYHDVSPADVENFEWQLKFFEKHFSPVDQADLLSLNKNSWKKNKPGLILSFDDGYRSYYEVVAPLLEKYRFIGWFFVSPGFIDLPFEEQAQAARKHHIHPKPFKYDSQRVFLTWEQIKKLDQNHVVGCHTLTHCRLRSDIPKDQLRQEIIVSKQILESMLNHEVTSFAWVGGEEETYTKRAAEVISEAGYKYTFLTNNSIIKPNTSMHLLNRTNIESHFSPNLLKFQISGVLDMMYTPKRRRVAKRITT